MNKEQVQEVFDVIQKVLDVAKLLFATNTQILGYIAVAENILKQDWLVQLVTIIASIFTKSGVSADHVLAVLQCKE